MFYQRIILFSLVLIMTFSLFINKTEANTKKFNMSYMFFYSTSEYGNMVNVTNNSLDEVAPNYFDINENGEVVVTNKYKSTFVEEMHTKGIKVVPFISNHWGGTGGVYALANREKLSTDIVSMVEQYNLDGINIDIEGIGRGTTAEPDKYRNEFNDLIRLTKEKMPVDKEVDVAVAANPNGWTKGWQGFYDYNTLSNYTNYLMIMAYDESWEGSEPGPVASYEFSEKSIQYALKQNVNKTKIVLGIPFYGRIWRMEDFHDTTRTASEKIIGDGFSLNKLSSLLNTYKTELVYDEIKKTPKITFEVKEGDPSYRINSWSNPIPTGHYVLWFENEQSIKEKLRLIQKYDIKGTGSWSLGQEEKTMWNYYRLWLDGKLFTDVSDTHWAKESIWKAEQNGWMNGVTSTTFNPAGILTRAQAAVILVRAFNQQRTEQQVYYSDIQNHWAKNEIEIATQHGIFSGVGDEKFAPDKPVTRAQMAVVFNRLLGNGNVTTVESEPFKDVNTNNWAWQSISIMKQRTIFGGFEDNTFKPNDSISRAQMATLMDRISGYIK